METLHTILLVLQVLVAISLIGLILIQHGKGADAGAAFGSGASNTVFGAQGSGNFLSRTTAILAFIFLTNSLGLSYLASQRVHVSRSLMDTPVTQVQPASSDTTTSAKDVPVDSVNTATSEVPVAPDASVSDVPATPAVDTGATTVTPSDPTSTGPAN